MSLPRELSVRQGRLHCESATELTRLRRAATPLPVTGAARLDTPKTARELVLDAPAADSMRCVALRSRDGTDMAWTWRHSPD
ncbi:hypothetical protein ACFXKI_53730 [Streptomyces mirabilis]|uniref:hypothetical protein n=1 Tax=Streptomyces mirabilis TaxID=68239 RepID=UPI0036681CC4